MSSKSNNWKRSQRETFYQRRENNNLSKKMVRLEEKGKKGDGEEKEEVEGKDEEEEGKDETQNILEKEGEEREKNTRKNRYRIIQKTNRMKQKEHKKDRFFNSYPTIVPQPYPLSAHPRPCPSTTHPNKSSTRNRQAEAPSTGLWLGVK